MHNLPLKNHNQNITAEIENKSYQHIKSKIAAIETAEIEECLYLLNALPKTHILYRI